MSFILIYVTTANQKEAQKIATHLLQKKLIACANIFPIFSLYWWKGKIQNGKEFVLILKTVTKNYNKIKKEVERIHSYKIPCIIQIPVEVNEKYGGWMGKEVGNKY